MSRAAGANDNAAAPGLGCFLRCSEAAPVNIARMKTLKFQSRSWQFRQECPPCLRRNHRGNVHLGPSPLTTSMPRGVSLCLRSPHERSRPWASGPAFVLLGWPQVYASGRVKTAASKLFDTKHDKFHGLLASHAHTPVRAAIVLLVSSAAVLPRCFVHVHAACMTGSARSLSSLRVVTWASGTRRGKRPIPAHLLQFVTLQKADTPEGC